MRGVGQERAERDDRGDFQLLDVLQQFGAEGAPAHVRFGPLDQHDVPADALRTAHREPGGRPIDPSGDAVHHAHGRSADLEVVVLVRTQLAQRGRIPVELEMLDRPAGRVTCVVPSFEGDDHDRLAVIRVVAAGPLGLVDGLTHRTSLRPGGHAASGMSGGVSRARTAQSRCNTTFRAASWPPT